MATTKDSLTASGQIVRKLLPYLRKRALATEKGSVRTWRIQELEERTLISKTQIRAALRELQSRTDAQLLLANDTVKLIGPRRINYRKAFQLAAVPCTPLAKNFRRHGVCLKKNLTSPTGWSQLTDTRLTSGRAEVVLTLENELMKGPASAKEFTSPGGLNEKWHKAWANRQRLRHLKYAVRSLDGRVRVIRVSGRITDGSTFHINSSMLDKFYWVITKVDEQNGRFSARITGEQAKVFPLRFTEDVAD